GSLLPLPLVQHRLDAGELLARQADPTRVLVLVGRGLEAELEQLVVELALLLAERLGSLVADLFHLDGHAQILCTNLVRQASLCAARRIASLAVSIGTPSIS